MYAPRTRAEKTTQRSGASATTSFSRRDGESSSGSLPGMSHFVVDLQPKASSSFSDNATTPQGPRVTSDRHSGSATPHSQSTDLSDIDLRAPLDGPWNFNVGSPITQPSYFDTLSQETSQWLLSAPGTASSMDGSLPDALRMNPLTSINNVSFADSGSLMGMHDLLALPSVPAGHEMELDAPVSATDRPGPLVDMSALLAEMSPYENRLRKMTGSDLHDYPIGDALFLAQRFHDIICAYNNTASGQTETDLSVLPNGLTHLCYRTMIQIYDAVFTFLHRNLSRSIDVQSSASDHKNMSHGATTADMHSYRGLRLNQLRSMCLCASWDPMRKAVSMLIASLKGAEGALSLSPDLRVITSVQLEGTGRPSSRASRGIFEEDMSYSLNDGRLYPHVREQARKLRKRVKEVQELLDSTPAGC